MQGNSGYCNFSKILQLRTNIITGEIVLDDDGKKFDVSGFWQINFKY